MATNPQTPPDTSQPAMSATQQHEANILRALEVSPYELSFLAKHLLSHDWIPDSTDEQTINDAVFDFCESFHTGDRYLFPKRVDRLNFIFRAYSDDEEYFDPDDYEDFKEAQERRLGRETAEYNALRSLIAVIAIRESRKRNDGA